MSDSGHLRQPQSESEASLSVRFYSEAALYWLLCLGLFYTLYFARTLLLPIAVALLFALLLNPLVGYLKNYHVPRTVSAIVLLICITVPIGLLGAKLAGPAERWMERIPTLGLEVSEEINELASGFVVPVEAEVVQVPAEEEKSFTWFGWFKRKAPEPIPIPEADTPTASTAVADKLVQGGLEVALTALGATPVLLAQLLTFVILVLFQLVFGQRLFEHAINTLPRVQDKRKAMLIVSHIQLELSRYIVTVSIINTGLGVATAATLALLGVEDALLWGALVGLLNFAPYIGPLIGLAILALAGLVQYGFELMALMPALAFFAINLIESQVVTPLVLGRHMRLNPLILVLWVIVWAWLWGAMGVLLSVPLLVCLKLAAQQLNRLPTLVELIEAPTY